MKSRCRIFVEAPLGIGAQITLPEEQTHYLLNVMRLKEGEILTLFNGRDGDWQGTLSMPRKKTAIILCSMHLRPARAALPMVACFAPIKGGRLEDMVEKATELGACALQPVKTSRTIVSHINETRLALIAREAAEQCERSDIPEIRPMLTLPHLLAEWPDDAPLFYGDESGASGPSPLASLAKPALWGTLTGPEGGFTPDEFTLLGRKKAALGVGLGPRILRADTACLTLLSITAQHFGDWHERPHFTDPRQ